MKRSVIEQYKIERMSDQELRNEWGKESIFHGISKRERDQWFKDGYEKWKKWDIEIYISKLKVNIYPK